VSTPPELPPEADAPPPDAEEGVEPPPAAAAVLDELDEQAASMTAAPTEIAPSAIRAAREFGLVFLNHCMRPRIVFIQESTRPHRHLQQCGIDHRVGAAVTDVNRHLNTIRSLLRLYCQTSTRSKETLFL
jgi:hypothetical protein